MHRFRGRVKGIVRTEHDVSKNLILSHLDVADSDTQAEHLLELELDGAAHLGELVAQVLSVRDGGGELASCYGGKSSGSCANE